MIVVEKELNYKTHFVNFYFLLDIKPVIYFSFVSSSMSWGRFHFIFLFFLLIFDKRVGSNWIVRHSKKQKASEKSESISHLAMSDSLWHYAL